MKTFAFIGLGVMGFPMAGHLSSAFNVRVYNRSSERAVKWQSANKGVLFARRLLKQLKGRMLYLYALAMMMMFVRLFMARRGSWPAFPKVQYWLIIQRHQLNLLANFILHASKKGLGFWILPFQVGKREPLTVH